MDAAGHGGILGGFVLFTVLAVLAACGPQGILVPDELERAEPGVYVGVLHFDARAKLGPVRIGRDQCDVDIAMTYDPDATPPLSGVVSCTLDRLGEVNVDLSGDITSLPFVEGDVFADPIAGTWDGWFVDEDTLHGESSGRVGWEGGIDVVYTATFDVDLPVPAPLTGG